MSREEIESIEESFLNVLQELQEEKVDEIIKRHKEFLPRFIIVGSVARIKNLIHCAFGNVKYFVVVTSEESKVNGLIKVADLIYLLLAGASRYSTFSGVSRIGILWKEIPIDEALKLVAEEVMRWGPSIAHPEDSVRQLLKLMWDSRAHAVIIVDEEGMPISVIDEDTVFSIVRREMNKALRIKEGGAKIS